MVIYIHINMLWKKTWSIKIILFHTSRSILSFNVEIKEFVDEIFFKCRLKNKMLLKIKNNFSKYIFTCESSIYILCLSVCLYPINIKTAEPIGPKFFVWSRVTPGKVFRWSNFQKFVSNKIRFLKIMKIHKIFCFGFIDKENSGWNSFIVYC